MKFCVSKHLNRPIDTKPANSDKELKNWKRNEQEELYRAYTGKQS